MEHFTNWCLVCELQLQHEAIYCSVNCLKHDFITATRAEYGPAGTVYEQKLRRDLATLGVFNDASLTLKRSTTVQRNLHQLGKEQDSNRTDLHEPPPPSPTPSAGSMSSSVSSLVSSAASESSSVISMSFSSDCPARAFLSPVFSLQIKSRRRKSHF
ncbi:hypothetical protein BJ741DRAFT_625408 [Chytriomyces cf. hyalinus JEL632]|nr:hypothetical protein BJ741DRAFT_625408 [Chytriomyces cf. hyalinus JEL632]